MVNGSGVVLSGYNFNNVNEVDVYGNNVTIEDSTFNNAGGCVGYCQLDEYGRHRAYSSALQLQRRHRCLRYYWIRTATSSSITVLLIRRRTPSRYRRESSAAITSLAEPILRERMRTPSVFKATGPVTVSNNFIDWTNNADALASTGFAIRIATDGGNTKQCLGHRQRDHGRWMDRLRPADDNHRSGCWCPGRRRPIWHVVQYQYQRQLYRFRRVRRLVCEASVRRLLHWEHHLRLYNPEYSINAWNTYFARGLGTAYLVSSTGNTIVGNPAGSTTLYGAGQFIHMFWVIKRDGVCRRRPAPNI